MKLHPYIGIWVTGAETVRPLWGQTAMASCQLELWVWPPRDTDVAVITQKRG